MFASHLKHISDYTTLLKFPIKRLALETLLVSTLDSAHPLHLLRIAPPLLIAPNQRAYLYFILFKLLGKEILLNIYRNPVYLLHQFV